jgi:hypothetical protein
MSQTSLLPAAAIDRAQVARDVRLALVLDIGKGGTLRGSGALRQVAPNLTESQFKREYDAVWRRLRNDPEVGYRFVKDSKNPAEA